MGTDHAAPQWSLSPSAVGAPEDRDPGLTKECRTRTPGSRNSSNRAGSDACKSRSNPERSSVYGSGLAQFGGESKQLPEMNPDG